MPFLLERPLTQRMLHAAPQPLRTCAGASTQDAPQVASLADDGQTCPADSTMARLLIHAAQATGDKRKTRSLVLRCLRPWAQAAAHSPLPAPSRLRIADLDGRRYFAADTLPCVIDLPLPAGIYHVTVWQGAQQRRYTVALGEGVAFDLHLRGD